MTRKCRDCGETKPMAQFEQTVGIYRHKCKDCRAAIRKASDAAKKKPGANYQKTSNPWELLGADSRPCFKDQKNQFSKGY